VRRTAERLLGQSATRAILGSLRGAHASLARAYPGEPGDRQPVHTVYGGAHLFKADTARKLGALARKALEENAPDAAAFGRVLGLDAALWETVYGRVLGKLGREPVEDFRIDFEDGYGSRPDDEEDQDAVLAAREVARAEVMGALPPFIGLRIKPLSQELAERGLRTLDIFVATLVAETKGKVPAGFTVTLPKVTGPEQVAALAAALTALEKKARLAPGSLRLELMVETTQAILGPRGTATLPALVSAAKGRCGGAHFGTYDYTAACNITAAYQTMTHQACDFAKHVMQVTLAGTGVRLSDGATNLMPVGPHRPERHRPLTLAEIAENRAAVHHAWRVHYGHVRNSLQSAFYQGWDLHPAQLPTRYAAVYAFFLEGLTAASDRLRNFIEQAGKATLVGDVFDDAATGQGLLNYFLRALNCGAITPAEAEATGLRLPELQSRSFVKILEGRRKKSLA
jgi:citrate lyase beta subunit